MISLPLMAARPVMYRTEVGEVARPIWLYSSVQSKRASKVAAVEVPMLKDQLARITARGEGSINKYPLGTGQYTFTMVQTMALVVFPPSVMAPEICDLDGQPGFPANVGGTRIWKGTGEDIGIPTGNYYQDFVRVEEWIAPNDGVYTFASYIWGGTETDAAGNNNAACVSPGTASIAVVVQ